MRVIFVILALFLSQSGWGQESIYGKQCAETDSQTRKCLRYHTCRAPREGESRAVECLCYKSWADDYPEIWKQVVAQAESPDYRSIGTGLTDSAAREDAKATCGLLLKLFVSEFVKEQRADQNAYQVAEEYCSEPFVCE